MSQEELRILKRLLAKARKEFPQSEVKQGHLSINPGITVILPKVQ